MNTATTSQAIVFEDTSGGERRYLLATILVGDIEPKQRQAFIRRAPSGNGFHYHVLELDPYVPGVEEMPPSDWFVSHYGAVNLRDAVERCKTLMQEGPEILNESEWRN